MDVPAHGAGDIEHCRPGGNDVNDTAAETAALHSCKLQASSPPVTCGSIHGDNWYDCFRYGETRSFGVWEKVQKAFL
ncbi:MAG: hypothetical protein IKR48_12335, partial [Kiritimatiellae bacterium]|nr:hypothetical protein [Kiritimatiellia bacterium]